MADLIVLNFEFAVDAIADKGDIAHLFYIVMVSFLLWFFCPSFLQRRNWEISDEVINYFLYCEICDLCFD